MELIGNYSAAYETLSNNANSQLVSDSKRLHVKLPPKFMGDMAKGVNNYLTLLMSKQERMGDAYPIAYTNIKIIQSLGKIISDQPCIHFDVNADFIFFKPVVGCKLEGKVNKLGKRHLGCLVHGCFNAWVPHTPITETLSPDNAMGADIEFTVVSISTNRNILSIKGKFDKFLSEELNELSTTASSPGKGKKNARKKKTNTAGEDTEQTGNAANAVQNVSIVSQEDNEADVSLGDLNSSKSKKKHKKKERRKARESMENGDVSIASQDNSIADVSIDNSMADVSIGDLDTSRGKSKRKKDKRKAQASMENGEVNSSIVSFGEPILCSTQVDHGDANTSSASKVRKHKKKRKHSMSVNELDDSTGDIISGKVNGDLDISDISRGRQDDSVSQMDSKHRKRKHGDNSFTKIKDRVMDDSVVTEPSPAKKHKKHKKHSIEKLEDSLDDFVVSTSASKKSKKKHKMA